MTTERLLYSRLYHQLSENEKIGFPDIDTFLHDLENNNIESYVNIIKGLQESNSCKWCENELHRLTTPAKTTSYDPVTWKKERIVLEDNFRKDVESFYQDIEAHPERLSEMLQWQASQYQYSPRNCQLLHSQNPFAVNVRSKSEWNKLGYKVNKNAEGIYLFVPHCNQYFKDEKGETKRVSKASPKEKEKLTTGTYHTFPLVDYFKLHKTFFDIAQTNCPEEKYPELYRMGYDSQDHASIVKGLCDYIATELKVSVCRTDHNSIALRGLFDKENQLININPRLKSTEELSTLSHELGHKLLHDNTKKVSTAQKEVEADLFSMLLSYRFGIDVTDSRKVHFWENFNEYQDEVTKEADATVPNNVLLNTLNRVQKLYKEVVPTIESYIDKTLETEQNLDLAKISSLVDEIEIPSAISIESTLDFSTNDFNELDGIPKYRIVTLRDGKVEPINKEVFTDLNVAIDAAEKIMDPVSYDELINLSFSASWKAKKLEELDQIINDTKELAQISNDSFAIHDAIKGSMTSYQWFFSENDSYYFGSQADGYQLFEAKESALAAYKDFQLAHPLSNPTLGLKCTMDDNCDIDIPIILHNNVDSSKIFVWPHIQENKSLVNEIIALCSDISSDPELTCTCLPPQNVSDTFVYIPFSEYDDLSGQVMSLKEAEYTLRTYDSIAAHDYEKTMQRFKEEYHEDTQAWLAAGERFPTPYYKTDFNIYNKNGCFYSGRYDLGDGDDGLINHIRLSQLDNIKLQFSYGDISEEEQNDKIDSINEFCYHLWQSVDIENINENIINAEKIYHELMSAQDTHDPSDTVLTKYEAGQSLISSAQKKIEDIINREKHYNKYKQAGEFDIKPIPDNQFPLQHNKIKHTNPDLSR